MADLVRTPERWAACSPEAVVSGSEAQMRFFVADAKADIATLLRRIAALEAEASKGERRGLERAAEVAEAMPWYRHVSPAHVQSNQPKDVAEAIRALIPEAPVREAEADRLRGNLRANFEAFATMYNDVNETTGGLPSLEGLLNLGPELQHACSALAEGVRSYATQKDDVISSALQYVKGKYDPSDDYDFAVYEQLRKAAPQDNREG